MRLKNLFKKTAPVTLSKEEHDDIACAMLPKLFGWMKDLGREDDLVAEIGLCLMSKAQKGELISLGLVDDVGERGWEYTELGWLFMRFGLTLRTCERWV